MFGQSDNVVVATIICVSSVLDNIHQLIGGKKAPFLQTVSKYLSSLTMVCEVEYRLNLVVAYYTEEMTLSQKMYVFLKCSDFHGVEGYFYF